MIQRIQTLLLAIVVILLSLNLVVPIWKNSNPSGEITLNAISILYTPAMPGAATVVSKSTIYIATLIVIALVLTGYTIFQYKDRMRQIKISNFLTLLTLGMIGAYFIAIPAAKALMPDASQSSYVDYKFGYYIPIICNILLLAARYFIRKDEELVRSVDRIR